MPSNVQSIDALRRLHGGVIELSESWEEYVAQLRQLAYKFQERIRVERRQYWQTQIRLAERQQRQAEEALARAKITQDPREGSRNTEAEINLVKARQRVRFCLEKIQLCKKASAEAERVVNRFIGELGTMAEMAETGLPNSAVRLSKWIKSLDEYAEISAGSTQKE